MRITQSAVTRNMVNDIIKNTENLTELQHTLTTGKIIEKPSDDPVKFSMAQRYRQAINNNNLYLKNIVDARSLAEMNGSVIDDLYSQNLSAKEIALKAADSTLNASDRQNLVNQVDVIIDEMVSLLNTQYLGKYIFAGTKTLEGVPFDYDGTNVTYNGDDGQIVRRIADNMEISININGAVFQAMGLIERVVEFREALRNNDVNSISNCVATLEENCDRLSALSAKIGSLKNQLNVTENRLKATNTNLNSFISDLEDADLVEIIAKYNAEELAYKAALQAASSAFNLSILDYL